MPAPSPIASRSVSGHVKLRRGKLRTTFYAKWRDARGVHLEDKLGLGARLLATTLRRVPETRPLAAAIDVRSAGI